MTVLTIILGVLMIFFGISMMCTPLATFLSAGYFLGIMMFVYGIAGIIRAFQKQSHIFETISSVLAVIVGFIALIRPGSTLVLDGMIVYMAAFWFVLRGALAIALAFEMKGIESKWWLGLIIGILSIVVGIYSFAHPMFMAVATGILIGVYFMDGGIDMIVAAVTVKKVRDTIEGKD